MGRYVIINGTNVQCIHNNITSLFSRRLDRRGEKKYNMKPSSGETLQQQQKNVVRYLIRLCCAVFADENYTRVRDPSNPLAKSHFFHRGGRAGQLGIDISL